MHCINHILCWCLSAQITYAITIPANTGKMLEKALCNTKHPDITPLDKPVIKYPQQSQRDIRNYLEARQDVFGKAAAQWQQEFFYPNKKSNAKFRDRPQIQPIRHDAPTIISFYYPHPNPRQSKRQDVYLERIKRLAKTDEQVMMYVAKDVAGDIKKMRNDKHWHVIDEYSTIWDVPNNKFQSNNFMFDQREFAAYNAKAFIAFDAPLRNPFGSERWIYMDAGLLLVPGSANQPQAPSQHGQPWDMLYGGFLDNKKIDRSISLTKTSGVVFPEYLINSTRESTDISSRAFNDPFYQWQNKFYLGGLFVGGTLDILDANGRYTGREEFITPIVAAMYPNTVYSQPAQNLPERLSDSKYGDKTITNWKFMLLSYSSRYGKDMFPEMRDPIAGRYCGPHTSYQPRGKLMSGKW
ncbi:hypothetical protein K461DRAFT_301255 [Myriangium duriaei CBS 260.36]|uniref:Uncharacterized protein n=1 Tax=Myriangium duriaei CBS 260.36 TaxID=1168546 RepID=A0A9P4IZH8_9PEZI|nr:hypothetical protein K461DRAFT_301255 [Myriangium duriaei CBS 260.36]